MTSVIALRGLARSLTWRLERFERSGSCHEIGLTQPHQPGRQYRMSASARRTWSVAASTIKKAVSSLFVLGAALIVVACVDEPSAPRESGVRYLTLRRQGPVN